MSDLRIMHWNCMVDLLLCFTLRFCLVEIEVSLNEIYGNIGKELIHSIDESKRQCII